MKQTTIVFLFIFSFASLALAADPHTFDFRKTKWGMSPEEVIQAEGKKPDHTFMTMSAMALRSGLKAFIIM